MRIGRANDRLRVVTDGLKVGDRVVVGGTQRVLPGLKAKVAATVALRDATAAARVIAFRPTGEIDHEVHRSCFLDRVPSLKDPFEGSLKRGCR